MCDWREAEHEYVTGNAGYREIASKHGVSLNQVADRGRRNNWPDKRKQYRDNVTKLAVQKTAEQAAEQLAKLKDNLIEASVLLSEKILADLKSDKHLKPYEYGHYTGSIMDLYKLVPVEADPLQNNVTITFTSEDMEEYGS